MQVEIWEDSPALLDGVAALARAGVRTGASTRNWASYGEGVQLRDGIEDWHRDLLTDPQTSGGLLIAVADEDAQAVLDLARAEGFDDVTVIGRVVEGPVGVVVS